MKRNKRISLLGECTNRKMNFLVSSFFYASLLEIKDRTSSTELELALHISYTDLDCIIGYIALLEQLRRFSSFIYGSVLEMRHY